MEQLNGPKMLPKNFHIKYPVTTCLTIFGQNASQLGLKLFTNKKKRVERGPTTQCHTKCVNVRSKNFRNIC